ncbi:MFS transporter [Streptomyces sp. NPDC056721]|uniref:MFS transporter n=1 Tax=unclassified Streptomyces TaxID=2593676 RepID=UPI00363B3B5B
MAAATGGGAGAVITARLVQGPATGLVDAQVIGTLQDTFRGQDRGRALGLCAVTAGVATALGSPLGGALVAGLGLQLGWSFGLLVSAPGAMLTRSLAPERR